MAIDPDGVVLDERIIEMIVELGAAREAKKEIEAQEQALRTQILGALAQEATDIGLTASGRQVCHVERQSRTSVNRKKLEALHPEIFEQVAEESEVLMLRLD